MKNKYKIVTNQGIDFLQKNDVQLICPFQTPVPVQEQTSSILGRQPQIQLMSKPCCSQCALFDYQENKGNVILRCGTGSIYTIDNTPEAPKLKLN